MRQQVDLRHHGANLPDRGGQSGGVFIVQLPAGRRLDGDVALVMVEDRQIHGDLRADVADVEIVAASGDAEHQVGKPRQDRRPQFGILRAVAESQRHQIGPPVSQGRQRLRRGAGVPGRDVRRRASFITTSGARPSKAFSWCRRASCWRCRSLICVMMVCNAARSGSTRSGLVARGDRLLRLVVAGG